MSHLSAAQAAASNLHPYDSQASLVDRAFAVRPGAAATLHAKLKTDGATVVSIDYDNPTALRDASAGCVCVVSALNGLEPVMIGMQGRLLDAAIAAGMARFIPSDFALNFSKTRPRDNTNLDLRRMFMYRSARAPIRATFVLTGAFADVLARGGQSSCARSAKSCIGAMQTSRSTSPPKHVAEYVAHVVLDDAAQRFLRIAGATVGPVELASSMTELTGKKFGLWRTGKLGLLLAVCSQV
jgi:hypothetical protein